MISRRILPIPRSLHSRKYRPDIDGLRAIAVSSVILFHAFPEWLPGGFVGVDIFFVISGYLISSILIKDITNSSFSILGFYRRRILRIVPPLITVLLSTLLVGWFCLFSNEFVALGRHIIAATLFSENFLLWSESSYFDVAAELKPTLHMWSLAIEEQFYIFWPLLMYLAYRYRVNLLLMFLLLIGISLSIGVYDIGNHPTAAYYSPLGRFWELMLGSSLAYIRINRPVLLSKYENYRSALGLCLIAVAFALINPTREFPGLWALLPTVGTLLLISSGENAWINRRVLSLAPLVWCGLISYELYLWHWPLLSFGHIVYGDLWNRKIGEIILVTVVASAGTFFFIEYPLRRRGHTGRTPAWLLASMVVPLGCGVALATGIEPPRLASFDAVTKTEWDFLLDRQPNTNKDTSRDYSLAPDRRPLVLFIGDSHIAQYAQRLARVIDRDPERPGAVLAIGGGCIPIQHVRTDDPKRNKCWPQRAHAYEIAMQPRFQRIVIGAAWNWYFIRGDYSYRAGPEKVSLTSVRGRKAAMSELRRQIERLRSAGKDVILMLDNPHSRLLRSGGSNGIRLSLTATNFRPNRMVRIDHAQRSLDRQLRALAEQAGAGVIDPLAHLCSHDRCFATSASGQPIYKDSGHLNPDWVVNHADFIDATVAPIGQAQQ